MRTIDELVQYVESNSPPEYVFFWGHQPRGSRVDESCLSQWFPSKFKIGRRTFRTAEHYMMYRKAEVFGDHHAANRALEAQSPREAKAVGRQVRGFDTNTWLEFRWDIIVAGNVAKFSQNEALQKFLLGTNGSVLVEASPVDSIWGIGMDKASALKSHPRDWQGENLLGFALMETRERLRSHAA